MHRNFKGVWIPAALYLDQDLTWTEKLVLVEIHSLENEQGCWASNEHFAAFLGSSEKTVANTISILKNKALIQVDGFGHRRVISMVYRPLVEARELSQNRERVSRKSVKVSQNREKVSQNRESPIYRINNTKNNTENTSRLCAFPADAVTPDEAKKPRNGTRISEEFRPDDNSLEWASVKTPDIDLDHHTEVFLNYWLSATGQRARKMDWQLTWRNWMLKEQERCRTNGTRQPKKLTYEQSINDALECYDRLVAEQGGEDDSSFIEVAYREGLGRG